MEAVAERTRELVILDQIHWDVGSLRAFFRQGTLPNPRSPGANDERHLQIGQQFYQWKAIVTNYLI